MMRLLLALIVLATSATAEEQVVGALSQNTVSITANFDGSEIFVFGAVKRDAPAPVGRGPLEVVIVIKGPTQRVTVRKKERVFGIWLNRDTVEVDEAPSFYAVATTAPLEEIMSDTERLRHRVGFDRTVRLIGAPEHLPQPRDFTDAVVRIRRDNGLYSRHDATVDLREETLFSTSVALPSNLVEGIYTTRMFLLRDRQVVTYAEAAITVRKEGLERAIYATAHERPLVYGILSVLVALFAGWGASEVFRLFRR